MGLIQIKRDPSRRDLRLFGCVWFPLFYGLIGALVFFKSPIPETAWFVWGVGVAVSVVGFFVLPLMRAVFLGLTFAAFPIGWTVSHVFLLFLYFLVLTPIGLLLRLFGHDAMRRRVDPTQASLWQPVEAQDDLSRYFRQT